MRNFSFVLLIIVSAFCTAQQTSNLIIFAEDATPFYAIVNGVKQNVTPATNVKVTGLTNKANQIKVIFENPEIPALDKQFFYQEMNVEATMKIANTKKGYKLRYFSEVSMGTAPIIEEQVAIDYHTEEVTPEKIPATAPKRDNTVAATTTIVEETVIENSSTPSKQVNGENISVNMNAGGMGINMNVNVSGNGTDTGTNANSSVNSSIITTTTTTTTSSGFTTDENTGVTTEVTQTDSYVPGYTGRKGCYIPSNDFNSIKAAVSNESFSDDRMNVAKQAIGNKCLTTKQVIEIAKLFDFEDNRLEFAKFAYGKTYDVDNYYKVNSVFDFSSTKEDLQEYIQSK